ncbi:DNA adenine methylase [Escherichia coli]
MINSPLIWAGGKSRAMPHVLDALPQGECLVEPFVGSGSVFLNTDYKTYILCDSNAALINFFSMVDVFRDFPEHQALITAAEKKYFESKSCVRDTGDDQDDD